MTEQEQLAALVIQALSGTFTVEPLNANAQASLLIGYCTLLPYVPAEKMQHAQDVLISAMIQHSRGPELVGVIRDLLARMKINRIITTEH